MRSTAARLAGMAVVAMAAGYALGDPLPSSFQANFEGLTVDQPMPSTVSGLIRRIPGTGYPNPAHMDTPSEILVKQDPDSRINNYILWDTGADAHVRINNSWNPDGGDAQFSLLFAMKVSQPMNLGFNQCFQWPYHYRDLDGTGTVLSEGNQVLQVGRYTNGGVSMGGGDAGHGNVIQGFPTIPMSVDPGTQQAVMSQSGDFSKWAYIRFQKLGSYIRMKGWGLDMPEPSWADALANGWASEAQITKLQADGVTIRKYAGFQTGSADGESAPGSANEAGLRFKWSAGLAIDNVSFKAIRKGDGDADGDVDGNDIGEWALNFTGELGNPLVPGKNWTQGDWDGDGDVDGNDAGDWALGFTGELGLGGLSVDLPNASPEAVAMLQSMGITVVPEPATLGLLAVGTMGLLRRRSRR